MKLAFTNYGKRGARAAWEVDHSRAKANGGTDHLNNLMPACIPCNREKGTLTSRAMKNRFR
jgi:5-methylcytosine-specific restriction endonuclease McrA